jgi:uncharacterized protein with gpF-like domain
LRWYEIDSRYPKENKSEAEENEKGKEKGKGKGKGRKASKEVAADSTPKRRTPSTQISEADAALYAAAFEDYAQELREKFRERYSPAIPEQSPSFAVPSMTYAAALNPAQPSSAIRRRPNFGSLPQDEEE